MEAKIGIYLITNLINQHKYVGISRDVYSRIHSHQKRAFQKNSREYEYPLYRAIRKYGLENFSFEILETFEEIEKNALEEKEREYIRLYDSYHNGYNQTPGGDAFTTPKCGEDHHNHRLTEAEVIDIRTRWAAHESVPQIWEDYKYKIEKTGFKKIYSWQTWKNILPELYTIENREWHRKNSDAFSSKGEKNPKAKVSEEFVREIRRYKKEGYSFSKVWELFEGKHTLQKQSLRNIYNEKSWKHITV